jgi:glycine cleavage system H lipoate-binding protein
MVFLLFFATVIIFLVVDFLLRREDRVIREVEVGQRSPIFLSPEKALKPVGMEAARLYHLSHSWALPSEKGYVYVGYDNFIPVLFSSDVRIQDLPTIGSYVHQGSSIWKVKFNGRELSQLAPVSGEIVDANPACKLGVPLPSDRVEKSWIIKMKPEHLESDANNLMTHDQAAMMNIVLRDELLLNAIHGHYVNDGGVIDPEYINRLDDEEWKNLVHKFFPYMQKEPTNNSMTASLIFGK